jgi:three-Cys-motif partner protein
LERAWESFRLAFSGIAKGCLMPSDFFDEAVEQSAIKTAIVSKYFRAWAQVIIPSVEKRDNRIAYIDLFCGPGRYKDGTNSTPIQILRAAARHPKLSQMLVTMFNDLDHENVASLQATIEATPEVKKLKHQPRVYNHEVGTEIAKQFEIMKMIPTFFFVDPWGYKGLSLKLINSVLQNWGCDCVFFFNYNRISMGLNNELVKEHMNALFGQNRAEALRTRLERLSGEHREVTIIEELSNALREMGGRYVLPFRFRNAAGNRTTHHLIFVSKHVRGYEIMKDVMARESSSTEQGVPSFEYNQASKNQPFLSNFLKPLDSLAVELLERFSGKRMTMLDVYDRHQVDTPFIKANYKEALRNLEANGQIKTDPPAPKRKIIKGQRSFADSVIVTFP